MVSMKFFKVSFSFNKVRGIYIKKLWQVDYCEISFPECIAIPQEWTPILSDILQVSKWSKLYESNVKIDDRMCENISTLKETKKIEIQIQVKKL